MKEYFDILGLSETASIIEVRSAYRKLSKKYHPDINSGIDPTIFISINFAYNTILTYFNEGKYDINNETENNYYTIELFKGKNIYSIGDAINVGDFTYMVNSFSYNKSIKSLTHYVESEGVFLIIQLTVINNKYPGSIHNYMFRLIDKIGLYYEFSPIGLPLLINTNVNCIDIFGKRLIYNKPYDLNLIYEVLDKDNYILSLCGGDHQWDNYNNCICENIKLVLIK